jgi:hypothetical protein
LENSGRDLVVERADVSLNFADLIKEPETFEEAFDHLDVDQRNK